MTAKTNENNLVISKANGTSSQQGFRIFIYENNRFFKKIASYESPSGMVAYQSKVDFESKTISVDFMPTQTSRLHWTSTTKNTTGQSRLSFKLNLPKQRRMTSELLERTPFKLSIGQCSFEDDKLVLNLSNKTIKQQEINNHEAELNSIEAQFHKLIQVFPEAFVKELINSDEFMVKLANTVGYRLNNRFDELAEELSQQIKDQQIKSSKELSDQLEAGVKRISDHWDDYWLRN